MPAFNRVTLIGNLTRDPELRYTPKGTAVANGGIAINRQWKSESGESKQEVTFLDFTLWAGTAENFARFTRKGSTVFLEGHLRQETWEKNDEKRSKIVVSVETFQLLDRKEENGQSANAKTTAARKA